MFVSVTRTIQNTARRSAVTASRWTSGPRASSRTSCCVASLHFEGASRRDRGTHKSATSTFDCAIAIAFTAASARRVSARATSRRSCLSKFSWAEWTIPVLTGTISATPPRSVSSYDARLFPKSPIGTFGIAFFVPCPQELIGKMLLVNAEARYSARDVQAHPWVTVSHSLARTHVRRAPAVLAHAVPLFRRTSTRPRTT